MKQLTCEMCGSTDLIKEGRHYLCQTCGTKHLIHSQDAESEIAQDKLEFLISQGRDILSDPAFEFYEDKVSSLKNLAQEILAIDFNEFYGHYFDFVSSNNSKSNGVINSKHFFNTMEKTKTEEERKLLFDYSMGIVFSASFLIDKISGASIISILDNDRFEQHTKIDSFAFLSELLNSKEIDIRSLYGEKIDKSIKSFARFTNKCLNSVKTYFEDFIFTEDFFNDNISAMTNILLNLDAVLLYSKFLSLSNEITVTTVLFIADVIKKNAHIMGRDFAKHFFSIVERLFLSIDYKCETLTYSVPDISLKVDFGTDSYDLIISENHIRFSDSLNEDKLIKAKDIMIIYESKNYDFDIYFYDIVYRVDKAEFTIFRLIIPKENDKAEKYLKNWCHDNDIKVQYLSGGENTPILKNAGNYKCKDTSGLTHTIFKKFSFVSILLQQNGLLVVRSDEPQKFYYKDIKHIRSINDKGNLCIRILFNDGNLFDTGYICLRSELNENLPEAQSIVESIVKKAKEHNKNYCEYEQLPLNQQLKSVVSYSGCYIATCVYGSYDCPEVWTLRRYRDDTLASTWYGRLFIRTYYAISPTLVRWFGHTNWFKKMWRGKLDKMVASLNDNGVENTPYKDKEW